MGLGVVIIKLLNEGRMIDLTNKTQPKNRNLAEFELSEEERISALSSIILEIIEEDIAKRRIGTGES